MNVDYNTETQEITVELNTPSIELDTPTGGRGLKGDTGPQGPRGETGPAGVQGPIGETGPAGQDGYDGYSPIVSTSKSGKTTTVTITDADGEKTATILDGEDGQDGEDGVSPIITTSKSGKTTTITIVDADGTKTATILDGEDGASTWGSITGTLSDQTDLKNALDDKVEYIQTQFLWTASENETQITTEQKNLLFTNNLFYFTWSDQYQIPHQYRSVGYYKDDVGILHINFECGNKGYSFSINRNRYVTKSEYTKVNTSDLSTVATSGSYTDLSNKPTIPTKVSDLTNDTGFITNTVNNLTNYYTSSNTYTKSEVDQLIGTVSALNIEVVQTLPTQDISTSTIYLVPNSSHGTNNYYDEYIYVSNAWELIGSTQVDLSNYYTKTQVDGLLDDKAEYINASFLLTAAESGTAITEEQSASLNTNNLFYIYDGGRYYSNGVYYTDGPPGFSRNIAFSRGKKVYIFTIDKYRYVTKSTYNLQEELVSGVNIKALNNTSILGSGNLQIETLLNTISDNEIDAIVAGLIQLEDMSYLFENSTSQTIDLSVYDTSITTNMAYMFKDCNNITSLDLSGFDTSNVISMAGMFYGCENLTSLDLSDFDTSSLTETANMFDYCGNLTSLDVTSFDTSGVTNMNYMFANCYDLTSLDVSNFNTSNVTTMDRTFQDLHSITSLDLSNFDTSNVTNMFMMFAACRNLEILDISNFDFSSITGDNYYQMFAGCGSYLDTPTIVYVKDQAAQNWILNLTSRDRPSSWSTSNVLIKGDV